MSIEENSFFLNAVPPFDFDEINEYYCWDGSDDDENLLHDLDTMVSVEIKELNEALPMEFNQDKTIIDYKFNLDNLEYDPFHITLPRQLKKRYQCDICLKSYATTKTLASHKQRHKNFKCDICNDEFNAKTPLSRHMGLFHKKTVPCDFCPHKFFTIQQLAEHLEKKHDRELRDDEQEEMDVDDTYIVTQPKNSLDFELKCTVNAFSNKYPTDCLHEFSENFFETDNVSPECTTAFPKYTPSSPKYGFGIPNSPSYAPASAAEHLEKEQDHELKDENQEESSKKLNQQNILLDLKLKSTLDAFLKKYPRNPLHDFSEGSSESDNGSPKYTPSSPKYTPDSPKYTPKSPNNTPYPKRTANSPKRNFKEDPLSELPEIKLPEKIGKTKRLTKRKKTMRDFFKIIEKGKQ